MSASNKDPDTPVKWKAVHGNLSLPSNAILLERLGLIDQLRSSFESSKQDITTVVLVGIVGIGGVGKTTLARLWGKRRIGNNPSITVWEFNAETEETLQKSMRDFSVQLAQTKARAKVYRRNSKCG